MTSGTWYEIGRVFPVIPVPLIASLALTLGFATLDPVHEAFAIYASDVLHNPDGTLSLLDRAGALWRLAAGVGALAVMGYVLWGMSRTALLVAEVSGGNPSAAWIPRMIGAAPLFGAATGMIATAFSSETEPGGEALLFVAAQFCSVLGFYIFTRFINRTRVGKKGDEALLSLLLLGLFYAGVGYAFHLFGASEMRLRVLGVALWSAVTCGAVALAVLGMNLRDMRTDLIGKAIGWIGGTVMMMAVFGAAWLILAPPRGGVALGVVETVAPWVPIIAFLITAAAAAACSTAPRDDSGNQADASGQSAFRKWLKGTSIAILVLGIAMMFRKVDLASLVLGPMALVAMLACLLTISAGYAGILSRKYLWGFPLTGALLILSVVTTALGWSDKTWVSTVSSTNPNPNKDPQSVADAFRAWNTPISTDPVYVVAAQGGGLFAGYHVAYALAALTEDHPEIAGQIFAISGVSGGSVGAGVYAAMQHEILEGGVSAGRSPRGMIRATLRRDFLSPVLGGLASYDLLLTLVQAPLPFGDRARGLEDGFETAVERGIGEKGLALLQGSIFDSWHGKAGVPALFLNATAVDTGARVVLSPVVSVQDGSNNARSLRALTVGPAPPLSTAMGLSARFPLVTPPGRMELEHKKGEGGEFRLADGGYFDNTGLDTASDIITAIRGTTTEREIRLIILRSTSEPFERGEPPGAKHGSLAAPLTAFVEAWRSRAALTRDTATGRTESLVSGAPGIAFFEFALDDEEYDFTLSWTLAARTFCAIESNVEHDLQRFADRFGIAKSVETGATMAEDVSGAGAVTGVGAGAAVSC